MNEQLFASVGLVVLCHFAQGREGTPWLVAWTFAAALAGYGARKASEERRRARLTRLARKAAK